GGERGGNAKKGGPRSAAFWGVPGWYGVAAAGLWVADVFRRYLKNGAPGEILTLDLCLPWAAPFSAELRGRIQNGAVFNRTLGRAVQGGSDRPAAGGERGPMAETAEVEVREGAEVLDPLERRLGRLYARQRLGIEDEREARVFGRGINYFHPENWFLSPPIV